MSISAKQLKRYLLSDLVFAVALAAFGAVYEIFSHGVNSYFMIYAFAVPLLLGVLPLEILVPDGRKLCTAALRFWHCGIVTLSTGCVFQGVLEIYGTTNRLAAVYPAAGVVLLLAAPVSQYISRRADINKKKLHSAQ